MKIKLNTANTYMSYGLKILVFYVPFRHFSACVYSVMGFPPMPQVPMPTLPLAASGVANIDFFVTPFSFFV